ncbi:hypothetical protein ACFVTE_13995 [Arthrobacter sp. NPDC058097]|uniref:hypothetical protein n=1 Tax=Arthrobacter sp. NPDC058097 TaxID=3346340 RepID=UPI0036D808AC
MSWARTGVRVVTMVTGGIIEAIPWQVEGRAEIEEGIKKASPLNRTTTLEDVGKRCGRVQDPPR